MKLYQFFKSNVSQKSENLNCNKTGNNELQLILSCRNGAWFFNPLKQFDFLIAKIISHKITISVFHYLKKKQMDPT